MPRFIVIGKNRKEKIAISESTLDDLKFSAREQLALPGHHDHYRIVLEEYGCVIADEKTFKDFLKDSVEPVYVMILGKKERWSAAQDIPSISTSERNVSGSQQVEIPIARCHKDDQFQKFQTNSNDILFFPSTQGQTKSVKYTSRNKIFTTLFNGNKNKIKRKLKLSPINRPNDSTPKPTPLLKKLKFRKSNTLKYKDTRCMFCCEWYSESIEDWIRCCSCKQWAHDSCAGVKHDDIQYYCDFCQHNS